MKLSIIIPVYNNINFTKSAINDLKRLPNDHEIIIVDNGSSDNTKEIIAKLQQEMSDSEPELIYISNRSNMGFGYANNQGYKIASGEYVLFLNNDIRVMENHETWSQELISNCKNEIIGLQMGLLNDDFHFVKETSTYIDSSLSYLSGWFLLARKETWEKLKPSHHKDAKLDKIVDGLSSGPWDEKYFCYFEDGDLSWRARTLGISLNITKAPIHHFGRVTGKRLNLSKMYLDSKEIFTKTWEGKIS